MTDLSLHFFRSHHFASLKLINSAMHAFTPRRGGTSHPALWRITAQRRGRHVHTVKLSGAAKNEGLRHRALLKQGLGHVSCDLTLNSLILLCNVPFKLLSINTINTRACHTVCRSVLTEQPHLNRPGLTSARDKPRSYIPTLTIVVKLDNKTRQQCVWTVSEQNHINLNSQSWPTQIRPVLVLAGRGHLTANKSCSVKPEVFQP